MPVAIDIARIAGLIGEPARANMLLALMTGQTLTATEMAQRADISKQTASVHLSRMLEAELLRVESQGRHRSFRLADADVAQLLEHLPGVAERVGGMSNHTGPRDVGLRKARVCYDHLAGDLGVMMFDGLIAQGFLQVLDDAVMATVAGDRYFCDLGFDVDAMQAQRRVLCRHCLDWSVRRHHLAGTLGAALFNDVLKNGWARRSKGTRAIFFTVQGETAFRQRYRI